MTRKLNWEKNRRDRVRSENAHDFRMADLFRSSGVRSETARRIRRANGGMAGRRDDNGEICVECFTSTNRHNEVLITNGLRKDGTLRLLVFCSNACCRAAGYPWAGIRSRFSD